MDGWPAYEPVAKYVETTQKKRLLLLIGNVTSVKSVLSESVVGSVVTVSVSMTLFFRVGVVSPTKPTPNLED